MCSIRVDYPELNLQSNHRPPEGARIAQALRDITNLKADFPLFIFGRAFSVVPPTSAGNGSGSFCKSREDGGCEGGIILRPLDPGRRNKWIALYFNLAKGEGT
jgi:hypothetical protein